MSYAYNLLADPSFVASLRQDNTSWTHGFTAWDSVTVKPAVTTGFTAGSNVYPAAGTVVVDQLPMNALIGDIFVFSGGSTITLTTAVNLSTDPTTLAGTVSGIYDQQNTQWNGIAATETIVEHKTHLPKFVKWPKDTVVSRDGRVDLVAQTSYDSTKHNYYGGGVAFAWGYTANIWYGNHRVYNTSLEGGYPMVTKLRTSDLYADGTKMNGSSQNQLYGSSDIRNVMTPDVTTTILQMRDFGGYFDRGEHQHDSDRKGGYWWVEMYLLDTNSVAKSWITSPYFFLEIEG